jgi:aspartyl aminopeptidase
VFAVFDNEEVGSETKQGAASAFFSELLREIAGEGFAKMLSGSFMISADNAHAVHPKHPELTDKQNFATLGGGVVVKYNANQRYTTDAYSDAIFRTVAKKSGARVQSFSNRADMLGGSTLGSIATTKLPIATVDIGLPQLAMHSANETMAAEDISDMTKALVEFYSTRIVKNGDKTEII